MSDQNMWTIKELFDILLVTNKTCLQNQLHLRKKIESIHEEDQVNLNDFLLVWRKHLKMV